ncbi:hypothetical protein [Porphyromonas pogonae]|nr:hypothetical protein [Porphyromonas pogonae]
MTKRESRKQRSNWPAMQRSHNSNEGAGTSSKGFITGKKHSVK